MEQVILVDREDQPIGFEEKIKAHREGLLHRAFSVFVLRKQGDRIETLVQKRALEKYHCGGLWSNTCCSHPRKGEEIAAAGERRLREEMGFTCPLTPLGSFHYKAALDKQMTEHEIDHVLIGWLDIENPPINPSEAAACKWILLADLQKELESCPERWTVWIKKALPLLLRNIR